ncbi:MAG: VOC family protein [Pseudomonadota bacterium]
MAKRIDHLVIVAHELEALASLYRKLGFQVGGQNRHDWGTLNHIVQFDGCFLELLSTEPGFEKPDASTPIAPFANFISDYLVEREGLGLLVLSSDDAARDQEVWSKDGIAADQMLHFERSGAGADGKPSRVAFSLAFASTPSLPKSGFFVCQQHVPENFWFADRQVHPNGAVGVSRVVLVADDPEASRAFLESFTGAEADSVGDGGVRIVTAAGVFDCVTPAACKAEYGASVNSAALAAGGFVAAHVAVKDLVATEAQFSDAGVDYHVADGRVTVPAQAAHGLALIFEQA